MTSDDVRQVQFEKVKQGYRPEDVDDYLMHVAAEMDALAAAGADAQRLIAQAEAAKADAESKMYILAQKVEEYREQEDTIKTTLLNAQRMGETVVKEAKQKADTLVRDATGQAELLHQQAEQEIDSERYLLENLRNQVTQFKATVLTLYKQHIESMSALDAPVAETDEALEAHYAVKGRPEENYEQQPAEGETYNNYAEEQQAPTEGQVTFEVTEEEAQQTPEAPAQQPGAAGNIYAENYKPVGAAAYENAPMETASETNLFNDPNAGGNYQ